VPDQQGCLVDLQDLDWESWEDPKLAAQSAVRWKMVFSGDRTPTGAMSIGMAEIAPGGVLPLHHHAPAEIYHVLEGHGEVVVGDARHELRPGRLVFIPADMQHRTSNTGPSPLRFLFVFAADSFQEVVYHFEE
jgi:quercetin dioxygenase-like cupin family protein